MVSITFESSKISECYMNSKNILPIHDIYLDHTIVRFPKTNCIYRILNDHYPEVIVTFTGDWIEECAYFDLASGLAQNKINYAKSNDRYETFNYGNLIFVSKESLPPDKANQSLPPILIIDKKNYPNILIAVNELQVHLDIDNAYLHFKGKYLTNIESFQDECSTFGNIPIKLGFYPLFYEKNRPCVNQIEDIYQQFLSFNNTHKLRDQYNHSFYRCDLRAHFVNTMLNCYSMHSFKIFKIWNNPMEWKKFSAEIVWRFHCATLIFDNLGYSWIWDPWVYKHQHLLSLKQWLSRKNEPKPSSVIITNSAFTYDFDSQFKSLNGSHFMNLQPHHIIRSFQAIIISALPNSPKKPIPYSKDEKKKLLTATRNDYKQLYFLFFRPSSSKELIRMKYLNIAPNKK